LVPANSKSGYSLFEACRGRYHLSLALPLKRGTFMKLSSAIAGLDPDQEGKVLWQTRIGKGRPLGGSEWGSAAEQDRIYVANSDVRFLRDGTRRLDPNAGGGLFGLNLSDGKKRCRCRRCPVVTESNVVQPYLQRLP